MFVELYNRTGPDFRLDLAEKMAERRNQSLAATRKPSPRVRMALMLFALAASVEKQEAWRMAGRVRTRGAARKWRSRQTNTEENQMYVSIDQELSRQHREEIRQEVVVARQAGTARANRETRPYVVRDLSWELARYLDAEPVSASASAASSGTGGHESKSG